MATRTLYEIPINGTTGDFDVANSSQIDNNMDNEIDNATFNVLTPFTVNIGDELDFVDYNSSTIFSGSVRDIEQATDVKNLVVYNYEILLEDKLVNDVFENVSPESLIQTIISTYAPSLTYIGTYTSGITITKYVSRNKTARAVIRDILSRLPGVTYRVDKDKNFDLFEIGSTTSATTLTNGSNSNINGGWTQDTTKQVTRLTLIGEKQVPLKVELFSGTGSQTDFVLAEIPVTIKVEVGGVEKALTVDGQTSGDYTLNKETKTVSFAVAPASGTDNITITYNYELNITVEQDSDVSTQDTYGIIEKEITRKFLTSMEDARDYAIEYLDNYATPLLSSSIFKVDSLDIVDFRPGDKVRVVDSINEVDGANIDSFFIIRSVRRNFKAAELIITVGDQLNRAISFIQESNYNIKQLYEQDNNSSLIQKSQQFINGILIQFDPDVTNVQQRTFASDTFYLEEDSSGSRNQMLESGLGDIMRETGYTSSDLDSIEDLRVTTAADTRVTTGTDIRITTSSGDVTDDGGIITTSYQSSVISNYISTLSPLVTHMAVGDDNTTPVIGDTTLGNQTYIDSIFTSNTGGDFVFWDLRLDTTENNGNTIKEIGTFDAASSGNMFTRNLTTVFDKTSSKEAYYQVRLKIDTEITDTL